MLGRIHCRWRASGKRGGARSRPHGAAEIEVLRTDRRAGGKDRASRRAGGRWRLVSRGWSASRSRAARAVLAAGVRPVIGSVSVIREMRIGHGREGERAGRRLGRVGVDRHRTSLNVIAWGHARLSWESRGGGSRWREGVCSRAVLQDRGRPRAVGAVPSTPGGKTGAAGAASTRSGRRSGLTRRRSRCRSGKPCSGLAASATPKKSPDTAHDGRRGATVRFAAGMRRVFQLADSAGAKLGIGDGGSGRCGRRAAGGGGGSAWPRWKIFFDCRRRDPTPRPFLAEIQLWRTAVVRDARFSDVVVNRG